MLQTLKNAWNTKEIRSKILFTLFILLIYRIGTVIPVPFVESNGFAASLDGTILQYMDTLSGGSLGTMTLFALGVQPYINASIIIQLLAVVFPKLGELAKNDKKKMNYITRVVTVILAIVTALGYYFLLRNGNAALGIDTFLTKEAYEGSLAWLYAIVIIACYTAGASLIMFLAERINEKGIGNGISLILFANIIASVPSFVYNLGLFAADTYSYTNNKVLYASLSTLFAVLFIAFMLALIALIIWFTGSERRIPVQYAKKVVGRKMYGGQSSNLPLKLNMAGVMPVIFANSIVSIPGTLATIWPNVAFISNLANNYFFYTKPLYVLLSVILLFAFAYFYIMISFNPVEVANNIRNNGGAIPGIRPGKPTRDYIQKILNRITFIGAVFLCVISEVPKILVSVFETIRDIASTQESVGKVTTAIINFYQSGADSFLTVAFAGTSILIVVGVILETVRELEAQLTMRNMKGFLD